MISVQQFQCPKCNQQYCQLNPPRLLTMCGHTFCQKCIKDVMIKKKANNKYKVVCPLDKMTIQVQNFNALGFPKNLSVLNMVKKKIQNSLVQNRISGIVKCPPQISLNNTIESIQGELQSNPLNTKKSQQQVDYKIQKQISQETCLLHQRPLELVCTRDFQRICASCVIFGEHRGHNVKNTHEVQQIIHKLFHILNDFKNQQKICFERLSSNSVCLKLQNMLNSKKSQLCKQITNKFKQLIQEVLHAERKTLSKLEKKMDEYKLKLQANLNEKLGVKQKYRDWYDNLIQKLEVLQYGNQQNRAKTALKSDSFVQTSTKNLQIMNSLQKDLIQQCQKIVDNLVFHADLQQAKKYFRDYCRFQDCNNSFLDMTASRMSRILNDQILLDNIQDTSFSISLLKQTQRIQQGSKLKKTFGSMSMPGGIFQNANSRLNRIKSINKDRLHSPNRKNSNLKSNRALINGVTKINVHNSLKIKDIPAKFQQKIEAVLSGMSDILDLTNGELSNQKVLSILQCVKEYPVTIIKLVRNKLTDQFLIKSLPYLNNTVMINMSRNQLTQKSIEAIVEARRNGGLCKLKSLMLGQNRIVQRKNKQVFQQLRKAGINICA